MAETADILDQRPAFIRLALCVLAGTVVNIGLWAVILILPQIQSDFGVNRGDASVAFTCAMIGFAGGNLLLGRWVDKHGIAPIMAVSAILLGICYALSTIAPNVWVFAALQIPIGFATSAGFGPLIADISHWFKKYRGIAMAATASGNYLSGTVWPLLLKDVVENEGWRTSFVIIAISMVVLMLPLAWALRERLVADESLPVSQPDKSISVSNNNLTALLLVAGLGCCIAMAMPQVHIVAYCVDLGFNAGVGAEMLSLMLAAGVVSRLVSGVLADRIGGVPTLLIGSVLQGLALFLYIPFNGLVSLYIVSFIFGLSQGGIVPSYAIIVREYMPAAEAGKRIGILMLATISGMAIGGWISGVIFDFTNSYREAFLHGIIWNLINVSVMVFILMKSRPRKPKNGPQAQPA